MTGNSARPGHDEFELTLFGPGYGESIALHIGNGNWVIVDSHLTPGDVPSAAQYLKSIGVEPAEAVCLIVATHWHDDHIRGIADLLEMCPKAKFCCANTLVKTEFVAAVEALEKRHLTVIGSGAREIYRVFEHLEAKKAKPTLATENRRIFNRDGCQIWSLSPSDKVFLQFLASIRNLFPGKGQIKSRVPYPSPNQASVVLWVEIGGVIALLGSDLEKRGWIEILQSTDRPDGKASVFKIPHHGSRNADDPDVWGNMLEPDPVSVLTPWTKGGRYLPRHEDIQRILSYSGNAYITSLTDHVTLKPVKRRKAVEKTIRESDIKLQRFSISDGSIRLRRPLTLSSNWTVNLSGSARDLGA